MIFKILSTYVLASLFPVSQWQQHRWETISCSEEEVEFIMNIVQSQQPDCTVPVEDFGSLSNFPARELKSKPYLFFPVPTT